MCCAFYLVNFRKEREKGEIFAYRGVALDTVASFFDYTCEKGGVGVSPVVVLPRVYKYLPMCHLLEAARK